MQATALPRAERPSHRAATSAAGARWLTPTILAAVTALAAVLRFAGFGRVAPNPYYDAAVRSMGQSWHNFFYGAFDPAAQVSVDKIPVDLWLQVASVKLFGFSSVALRLPEALAATLAVPLLYAVVRRLFGRTAGLASTTALAVMPVSILTGRSDTMDSVMMALLVASAWCIVAGAQRGRAALVVAGGAVAGLAFEVKLFEALLALPALAVLAALILDGPVRRRAVVLAGAGAAFLGSSVSWLAAWSLAGGGQRPWPIGSTNGSAWNVVFGFNGIDRLRDPATAGVAAFDPPGLLRLVSSGGRGYGALVGALVLAAVVLGSIAAVVVLTSKHFAPVPAVARMQRAGAAWIAVWLTTGIVLLSMMQRVQLRYLDVFTPAVAAAVGVAVATLAAAAGRRRSAALALVGATAVVAVTGSAIAGAPPWATAIALGGVAATGVLALVLHATTGRRRTGMLAVAALVAVLAVPFAGSARIAGGRASDSGHPGTMPAAQVAALSSFLTSHQGSARYEAASSSVAKAGPLIVRDGRPVLMLTSLHDRPLLSAAQLARLVSDGQVRYVLLGKGSCSPRSSRPCAPVVRWARDHAVDVSAQAGLGRTGFLWQLSAAPAPHRPGG